VVGYYTTKRDAENARARENAACYIVRVKSAPVASGRCSLSGKSKSRKKSHRFRGDEIHVDINSHHQKGKSNLSGKQKKSKSSTEKRSFQPFTIGGSVMATKKKGAHKKGGAHKKRMHGGEFGGGGDPGRKRGRGRRRGRGHGLMMGGAGGATGGVLQAFGALASALGGALGAGYGSQFIPGPATVKNGVPLLAGIALTLVRNPIVKGIGLGMALVGSAKIIKGFVPTLPLLGDDRIFMLPNGRMISGDGIPLQLEHYTGDAMELGAEEQLRGDQVAVRGDGTIDGEGIDGDAPWITAGDETY
jgi:hypothetical protein